MKKRVPMPTEFSKEIDVCDKCGEESIQDDVLRKYDFLGEDILLHPSQCAARVADQLRHVAGLLRKPL